MTTTTPFSRRNQYAGEAQEITIPEDAPETLRTAVLSSAVELGFGPKQLRAIICRVLRARPDPDNWSEYPNVWVEVQWHMYDCKWFKVYDIIEALYAAFRDNDGALAAQFAEEINACFLEEGIGWQLVEERVVTRGTKG